MADGATSTHLGVQTQLDRLAALGPGADILGLDRIERLLARLGNPERALPPVFHVAGTNGKGSTCAFLRAALEAAGHRVHVYSSPHLVRFNERIRLAGQLIDDEALAAVLAEVLDAGGDIGASFFEVTTAAAFLAFARTPAAATIVEVGLGGRLDATNIVSPVVTGIAALGMDHQGFLGDTLAAIAAEKAGIAKRGVPLVTMHYAADIAAIVHRAAAAADTRVVAEHDGWSIDRHGAELRYTDAKGALDLPMPILSGGHQVENLGLAIAMLRHQQDVPVPVDAMRRAATDARWPARLQRLDDGPLLARLPPMQRAHGVWLDGAHNPSAAAALASAWTRPAPIIAIGMLANKDAATVVRTLVSIGGGAALIGVPVGGHAHHPSADLAAIAQQAGARWTAVAPSIDAAFDIVTQRSDAAPLLIAGSLYLAGEILRANEQPPT